MRITSNTGRSDSTFARYLLGLEDESFFTLIRNYLGPVRTPYNKHELIAKLVEFLSRDETRRRILALLDEEDRLVLRAVLLLGPTTEEALCRFLREELEYGQLFWLITSLRDRLLLIDGSVPFSIRVNPLLQEDLLDAGIRPESLVAGALLPPGVQDDEGELPWFSRAFIASLYAFLREEPNLYTRSGALRKRAATLLRERFPHLFHGEAGERRLATALQALATLSLIEREAGDEPIGIVHDAWDELAELPDNWIQALLWATLVSSSLERAFDAVPVLLDLSRRLPRDRCFTGAEILRALRLAGTSGSVSFGPELPDALADSGMLLQYDGGYRLNPTAASLLERSQGAGTGAALQANMEVTLSPELSFRTLLDVAGIARLLRYDVMPVLEITAESLASARRCDRQGALEMLERISGAPLPQSVSFLLTRWLGRADAIRLARGLVLRVDEEAGTILDTSPEFSTLPKDVLAPGVFLFHPDRQNEVQRILDTLALHLPGGVENPARGGTGAPEFQRFHARYRQPLLPPRPPISYAEIPPREPGREVRNTEEDTLADVRDALRTMNVPEEVERELALRIERKLILYPRQIRADLVARHGMEARGLDYLGKLRVAEQAIAEGELLEIIMRGTAGTPQRILVRPRELSESGGDLMLRATQLPEGSAVRIRIRRASLVRRLSGTLLRRRSER